MRSAGKSTSRAGALRRIQAPVCVGDCEASDQKHAIEHDLEPSESAEAELARDVASQNLEEGVDWIVAHDMSLVGLMSVMPDVREFSRTGFEVRTWQAWRHCALTTFVVPLGVTAALASPNGDIRKRWSRSSTWFCVRREAALSGA